MKNNKYYIILCLTMMCTSLRGELVWETKDYGCQRNLSNLAFKYGLELLGKSQGDAKVSLARELSIMSFYYWLDTKRSEELCNRGVEIMIKTKLYPVISEYERKINKPFYKDPLVWLKHESPVINPPAMYKLDKKQYKLHLADFNRFLNAPVSEPKTRVKFRQRRGEGSVREL